MNNISPENQAVLMVREMQKDKISGPDIARELLKHFNVNIACSALYRQYFIVNTRDNRLFVSEESHIDNTFLNTLVVFGGFDSYYPSVKIPDYCL